MTRKDLELYLIALLMLLVLVIGGALQAMQPPQSTPLHALPATSHQRPLAVYYTCRCFITPIHHTRR
jgi:hypothetical protein